MMNNTTITIPDSFKSYVDVAIVRASYLFPELTICIGKDSSSINISGLDETMDLGDIKKEFMHILYRERIYSETLAIRKTIYGSKNE
jgi:hypothetical protein